MLGGLSHQIIYPNGQNGVVAIIFTYTDPTMNPRNGAPMTSSRSPRCVERPMAIDALTLMTEREPEAT